MTKIQLLLLWPFLFNSITAFSKPPFPQRHLEIPLWTQTTSYGCGAASFAAVLDYWQDYDRTERALYKELETSGEGTDAEALVRAARGRGLSANLKENLSLEKLSEVVQQGRTVIVNYQAWPESNRKIDWRRARNFGHYSVVVAVDNGHIYLMDPMLKGSYGYIPLQEFAVRWHDEGREHLAVIIQGKKLLALRMVDEESHAHRLERVE